MRSKEYVGALAMIAAFLLLKIGSIVALYKASPPPLLSHPTFSTLHHQVPAKIEHNLLPCIMDK